LPWTVAVVRRVKKRLAGKRVEIGAEYLGSNPRRVRRHHPGLGEHAAAARRRRPSTLRRDLPAGEHTPALRAGEDARPSVARTCAGDLLSVRSHTDHCTIQLGEPLEEQAGFVWSPFEILDRWLREGASEPRSGTR
jgi:hypothetical protein